MTPEPMIATYGTQAYHAARRMAQACAECGQDRELFEQIAEELQRRGYADFEDLGPSPGGGPALLADHALMAQPPYRILPDGRRAVIYPLTGSRARLGVGRADDDTGFDDSW